MVESSSKKWFLIALVFFIISASMGVLLRWIPVSSIVVGDYAMIRQGHSHIAFLGWAYLALMVFLIEQFLPDGSINRGKYKWNLILTSVFIAGMIFSFPLWGYKVISITLLTLFLVVSIVFVFHFFRDLPKTKEKTVSRYFLNTAFIWYILSGIGPFALAPIVLFYGKGDLYHLTVYYYLHFLYNGFFVFGIGALFFKYLENKGITYSQSKAKSFFWLSTIACAPAYALSTLWALPPSIVFWIGGLAALAQLIGFIFFVRLSRDLKFRGHWLLIIVIFSYGIKLIFQLLSVVPVLVQMVYAAKSYVVIGYIHLVTIGLISVFLLAWAILNEYVVLKRGITWLGMILFLSGFVGSETLLFLKGLFQWIHFSGFDAFFIWLAIFSTFMPLGILLFLMGQKPLASFK